MKFKIEEYNDEVLFLQRKEIGTSMHLTELILEDCNAKEKNLYYNGEIFQSDYYFYLTLLHKFSCVYFSFINS